MRFRMDVLSLALMAIAAAAFAADSNSPALDLADVNQVSFPYTAEITGTDIYMRSGPGMNYYRCGKLSVPETVTVIAHQNGWSKIVPPANSFSWISKEFVKIDSNNPDLGKITGDDVRVWAGSEYVEPMHSTSLQSKLQKGQKVTLLGEEKGDYYKIAPPKGACLWINTQYTRFVNKGSAPSAPAAKTELVVAEANAPAAVAAAVVDANEPNSVINTPKPKPVPVEFVMLKKYRELSKQADAERAKPVEQQDWTALKAEFAAIADNNEAGKAARYAKSQLERIEDFELIITSTKALKDQQAQLSQKRDEIAKKHQSELAKIPNIGRFVAQGILKVSQLYASDPKVKRYIVADDSGKIVAYAVAASGASVDTSSFIGKKVGLVGTIDRDAQSGSSIVSFTEIVALN